MNDQERIDTWLAANLPGRGAVAAELRAELAAHLETEILYVDEVRAVGDAEFQKRCLDRMSAVASQRT